MEPLVVQPQIVQIPRTYLSYGEAVRTLMEASVARIEVCYDKHGQIEDILVLSAPKSKVARITNLTPQVFTNMVNTGRIGVSEAAYGNRVTYKHVKFLKEKQNG